MTSVLYCVLHSEGSFENDILIKGQANLQLVVKEINMDVPKLIAADRLASSTTPSSRPTSLLTLARATTGLECRCCRIFFTGAMRHADADSYC